MSNHHQKLSADQIQQRMNCVRHELNDDVEQVVDDANSLGDLRAYVKARPIGWLIAAAVAGFAVVPSKKEQPRPVPRSNAEGPSGKESQPVKKGSVFGAALGMAVTLGTRLAMNKLATVGAGLFEQAQQGRASAPAQDVSASFNQESYSG